MGPRGGDGLVGKRALLPHYKPLFNGPDDVGNLVALSPPSGSVIGLTIFRCVPDIESYRNNFLMCHY